VSIELIESGKIMAVELATHSFPLEEAEQAFEMAKSKAGCMVLFVP
jgi:threonine dehydrogenase-like Zn-dependent dehydrogenase